MKTPFLQFEWLFIDGDTSCSTFIKSNEFMTIIIFFHSIILRINLFILNNEINDLFKVALIIPIVITENILNQYWLI